jgi:hypothetical protein
MPLARNTSGQAQNLNCTKAIFLKDLWQTEIANLDSNLQESNHNLFCPPHSITTNLDPELVI